MSLTKDQILSAEDLPLHKADVPEWGGELYIRGMDGKERDEFDMELYSDSKATDDSDDLDDSNNTNMSFFRARLLVRCIRDVDGNRIFTNDEYELLANKSGAALERLFPLAQRLSGIGSGEQKKIAKN